MKILKLLSPSLNKNIIYQKYDHLVQKFCSLSRRSPNLWPRRLFLYNFNIFEGGGVSQLQYSASYGKSQ